jgi:hypothetical protein
LHGAATPPSAVKFSLSPHRPGIAANLFQEIAQRFAAFADPLPMQAALEIRYRMKSAWSAKRLGEHYDFCVWVWLRRRKLYPFHSAVLRIVHPIPEHDGRIGRHGT